MSIVQSFPVDWYQFLTWKLDKTSSVQEIQKCIWTASNSVECSSDLGQTAFSTANQVPITGFYTDPGNPTPVFSYLSNCFLGSNMPAFTSHLAGQTTTTMSSFGIPSNTQQSTSTSSKTSGTSHPTSGLSTGAKAGIGVGAALGGILLIALGAFGAIMLMRRHSRKGPGADERHSDEPGKPKHDGVPVSSELEQSERAKELATGKEAHELSGRSRAAELAANTSKRESTRHELPAG
jgi:hypothetical protein